MNYIFLNKSSNDFGQIQNCKRGLEDNSCQVYIFLKEKLYVKNFTLKYSYLDDRRK